MDITKLLFKDNSKQKLDKAQKELDKAGQALTEAKEVFKHETDKALEKVEQPLQNKKLSEQVIEQAQAELLETTDFTEITKLIEQVEQHEKVIKVYNIQYENNRKQDYQAVIQAYVEMIQAQEDLNNAIKTFKKALEPFTNEDNKEDVEGIIKRYTGLFYDNSKVGNRLDRLNMLETHSVGVQQFKTITLPDGKTKKSFRNL